MLFQKGRGRERGLQYSVRGVQASKHVKLLKEYRISSLDFVIIARKIYGGGD